MNALPDDNITLDQLVLTADQDEAQYQWINCGTNTPVNNAVQQSFAPVANGNYAVIITSAGCDVQSECVEVIVISVDGVQQANLKWRCIRIQRMN
ncbi:MAG: hypothetical protein U5L01_07410 [Rheinheimera sp.]|nr:hypothetical protein [Rheinheimera sp.]